MNANMAIFHHSETACPHFRTVFSNLIKITNYLFILLFQIKLVSKTKHLTIVLVQIYKPVFCKILHQISLFCVFSAFKHRNAENDYFDQRLGCAAPKRWSKYTTHIDHNKCMIVTFFYVEKGLPTRKNI